MLPSFKEIYTSIIKAEGRRQEAGAEEQRSGGAEELGKKRELIIFGYNAQEIPPKISFTRRREKGKGSKCSLGKAFVKLN
ncbi:MAG: hypothetical protein F6K41_34170 [Symploca sp. SIO3E6]|nr:hypothetical protein [Caldora sp. SIO3E6]